LRFACGVGRAGASSGRERQTSSGPVARRRNRGKRRRKPEKLRRLPTCRRPVARGNFRRRQIHRRSLRCRLFRASDARSGNLGGWDTCICTFQHPKTTLKFPDLAGRPSQSQKCSQSWLFLSGVYQSPKLENTLKTTRLSTTLWPVASFGMARYYSRDHLVSPLRPLIPVPKV